MVWLFRMGAGRRQAEARQHLPEFLRAAAELGERQVGLHGLLRKDIDADPYAYFVRQSWQDTYRATGQPPRQEGAVGHGAWQWFAHGLVVDFVNQQDGRELCLDFGPGGRIGVFTGPSVARFACASVPPWGDYPALRKFLADADEGRCEDLVQVALQDGRMTYADPALMALREAFTTVDGDGFPQIDIPENRLPQDPYDVMTCDRLVLTGQPPCCKASTTRSEKSSVSSDGCG